ncbi:MAG TPA: hypothetical protein VMD76_03515, partial [Candidatus Sulfotelmatobacter sp.]|nr:hypothetical protein [Candidatus Sulfotelmatobacter sp.]
LTGVFRLAERVANVQVAVAATVCTAAYPVFFAQSSLAQVDLAAAGLTFWALATYLEDRMVAAAAWFSLAVLAKETAILAPMALLGWECLRWIMPENRRASLDRTAEGGCPHLTWPAARRIAALAFPLLPLVAWYAYHYAKTGYVFGNPEFFRYNVSATANPVRFVLALLLRLWQAVGYLHLWVLTGAMALAMLLPEVRDAGVERRRIAIPVQAVFLVVIVAYVLALALIGGAVLARYMLTVVPLVIILAVSTLYRRLQYWTAAVGAVAVVFVVGWFWNPPYGFSPEDNLTYRDYVILHEDAARFVEARYPMAHVLTAWPGSDELTRPWLGYTTRPMQVVRIEDFTLEEVISAAEFRSHFEVAMVFSTRYEPGPNPFDRWRRWTELKRRFFGFHRDLPPAAAARILDGKVVFSEQRKGEWVAVIEMEQDEMQNAEVRMQK